MDLRDCVDEIGRGLLTILGTVIATVVGINVLGLLIAGRDPGYNSAQGGGSLYFFLSIFAVPFAVLAGGVLAIVLSWRRRNRRRRDRPEDRS